MLRGDDRPGPLTLDDYCARRHVMVSFSGDLSGNIDQDLARIGRSRQVVLAVPQFGSLRALLRGTEMIATVPDYAACTLVDDGSLRADDAPSRWTRPNCPWSGAAPTTTTPPSAGCASASTSSCPANSEPDQPARRRPRARRAVSRLTPAMATKAAW